MDMRRAQRETEWLQQRPAYVSSIGPVEGALALLVRRAIKFPSHVVLFSVTWASGVSMSTDVFSVGRQ